MKTTILKGVICMGICGAMSLAALAQSSADQVAGKHIFASTLTWSGSPPSEAESATLLKALTPFENGNLKAGLVGAEEFLGNYTNSAWGPSLRVNLAEYYREHGRYSLALAHWEKAWEATKSSKERASQKLAVRCFAGWSRLLASIGHKEKLADLFHELSVLQLPLGSYSPAIESTKDGLELMRAKPDASYRCGSYALANLASALQLEPQLVQIFSKLNSPDGGFYVSQLLTLAETNGLALQAVKRPAGDKLVVPSVVHWKLNHYAAIIAEKAGRYKVADPTFRGHVWMDLETIDAEASGVFLVPKATTPDQWSRVTPEVCANTYGRGGENQPDDTDDDGPGDCGPEDEPPAANDGPAGGDGDDNDDCPTSESPSETGMPLWFISEPYATLWLRDTPLLYARSDGQWQKLQLRYKHRGEDKGSGIGSFGPFWECNLIAFLEVNSAVPDVFVNHAGGGGKRRYSTAGTPDYKSQRKFKLAAGVSGGGGGGGADVPALESPRGGRTQYQVSATVGLDKTNHFLTHRIDRYGRISYQNYETIGSMVRLTNVVDLDGKAMTFAYTNTTFTNQITSVTDPYGRVARFIYDADGLLTNIVDMAGLATSFQYDGSQRITEMVTPYGTNTFEYFTGTTTNTYSVGPAGTKRRAVRVTEPTGVQQLTAYVDWGPDGWRNSFHWDRAQYAAISAEGKANVLEMPDADFEKAVEKNWQHGDGTVDGEIVATYTVRDTLLSVRTPAVDGYNMIFYDYGDQKRVTSMSYSSSGLAYVIARNSLGRPTNITYYQGTGPATFTNNFDASEQILQTVVGPRGERIRGYGYHATITNLLTSVTNAADEVIRYTHDTSTMKVTSVTLPSGLVRSNLYIASGTYQGFKSAEMKIGFATNYFSYENGNLKAQTNELGLVTTYLYDDLNRLISTTYPDATTVSNRYDKLDLIATKDRLNQWSYFGYNRLRQLIAETNVAGQVTTYQYCNCGSLSEIVRWNGSTPFVTQYKYNLSGNLTNVTYPDGYEKSYTYAGDNKVDKIKDSSGVEVQLNYTLANGKHAINYVYMGAGNNLLYRQFDDYGRVFSQTDRNGVTITNGFDEIGRLTNRATIDISGGNVSNVVSYVYTAAGLTNSTDELGHKTWFVYDAAGRLVSQTNANGEVLQFTYNPAGQMLTLKDGKNQQTSWNYDEFGHVTNKLDASSTVIFKYKYDQLNRLTNRWTVAKGDTFYKYDLIGNLTNVDYPGTILDIVLKYDGVNRLTNVVDAIGTTKFGYTDAGQLTSEDGPWADDTVSYAYSARRRSGLSLVQPNASPWTQGYGYDEYNRLSNIVSAAGNFLYGYAGAPSDRVQSLGLGGANSYGDLNYIENEFDALMRLKSTTLKNHSGTVLNQHRYDLNEANQRIRQTFSDGNSAGNTHYTDYTYDDIGQLKTAKGTDRAYDYGVYDFAETPRSHEQFGYAYDGAWNLNYRTNNALTQTFSVDSKNQLTSATRSGTLTVAGLASEPRGGDSYWGSPAGVTNVSVSGTGLTTGDAALYADGAWAKTGATLANGNNTYTATAKDTYNRTATDSVTLNLPTTVSFSYDGNGNLTGDGNRVFEYDYENQLTNVYVASAWRSEFKYDGFGRRRVRKEYTWQSSTWLLTNEVRYVYDGMLVVQERDANNLPQVSYTRGNDLSGSLQGAGGIGGLLARTANPQLQLSSSAGSAHAYYHADGNGNITALVNTNGVLLARYHYDPYGNLLGSSGPLAEANTYRFSSKEYQVNSALYYYGYRFYEPNAQRWLNRDPIGESGGLNVYSFCMNSAIRFIDSLGLHAGIGPGMGDFPIDCKIPGQKPIIYEAPATSGGWGATANMPPPFGTLPKGFSRGFGTCPGPSIQGIVIPPTSVPPTTNSPAPPPPGIPPNTNSPIAVPPNTNSPPRGTPIT